MKQAGNDCSPEAIAARRGGINFLPGRVRFGGYPLSLFAQSVSNTVGRAVVDRSGLAGNWDFELNFAAPPPQGPPPPGAELAPTDPDAPHLFTAVREQLGLKLASTKGPIEVLVIDSIEMATPD